MIYIKKFSALMVDIMLDMALGKITRRALVD